MKTLSTIAAAFLMIISLSSFATDKAKVYKTGAEYNAKKYISAITQGDTEGLEEILDKSLISRFARGTEIKSYGKKELLNSLKEAGKVQQNCSTAYQILETEDGESIVLISMKYDNFTKISRLTLKDSNEGFKISRIASWYK